MLEILYYSGSEEEAQALASFDPLEHLLVCAGVRTKRMLQEAKLTEKGWLPGNSILRAREFWQSIYRDVAPAESPMGHELGVVYFHSFLQEHPEIKEKWPHPEGLEDLVLRYVDQLLPLLGHDRLDEILQTIHKQELWPREKLNLTELCRDFFFYLRRQRRYLASWCPALLLQTDGWWNLVPKSCYFYLHSELGAQEAELIGTLSRYTDVKVLAPALEWQKKFPKLLRGYEVVEGFKAVRGGSSPQPKALAPQVHRYSSTLSECKDVVSKIRAALEEGASPRSLLVLAPQIEDYWGQLGPLLEAEGIPVAKPQVRRLHSFFDVQLYLSRLRQALRRFRLEDVELVTFGKEEASDFETFRKTASVLLEWSDLKHLNFDEKSSSLPARMDRQQFLHWCLEFWPEGSSLDRLELLFKNYFHDMPHGFQFSPEQGVRYLETLGAQIEVGSDAGASEGVVLDNLESELSAGFSHLFCLGLAQESFDRAPAFLLSPLETSLLEKEFGLTLESPHFEDSDFHLEWIPARSHGQIHFSYSESDLAGRVLSPSLPWLQGFQQEGCTLPGPTCWEQEVLSSHPEDPLLLKALNRDLGQEEGELVPPPWPLSLSPSGLEDYFRCPFTYWIKRGLRFPDDPGLDLDISDLERGSLVHKLFELLIQDLEAGQTAPDFESVLNRAQQESGYSPVEDSFWTHQSGSLKALAEKFWDWEVSRRALYPEVRSLEQELEVVGAFDPETGRFVPEFQEGYVRIRGKIDRVDAAGGDDVVILDYKSTLSRLKAATGWLKAGNLQLIVYAMALEAGLTHLGPRPVKGAFYYGVKPLGKLLGFCLEGWPGPGKPLPSKKHSDLKEGALEILQSFSREIIRGHFPPRPNDKKLCNSCDWRGACRAPHLS